MRRVAGILLAAGRSERFGADKLLAPLPDGTPVGLTAARRMQRVLPQVVAVVRPGDGALSARLAAHGVDVHECARAGEGMGNSIACGVAATAAADAWLVALADMPFIDDSSFRRVAQALVDGAELAAPVYRGQRGHPVGFGKGFRDVLLALDGDRGARDLLDSAAAAAWIEVDDPGVLWDIDVPADLGVAATS
jgi:molybdenum cofactor cytidylyltransferase